MGLVGLEVLPQAGKVRLTYDPAQTTAEALQDKLETLGFPVQTAADMAGPPKWWQNPKVLSSLGSGLLLGLGALLGWQGAPPVVSNGLYLAAIFLGGYHFGREALEEWLFEREVGIEMLMMVAALAAAALGEVAEGAILVFLYSISEAMEGYTEEKTRSAIRALMQLAPKVALVRREGREVEIPVAEIRVGEVFIVRPGESVATDGEVVAGTSSVDQSPVTGESVPVVKRPGDPVFAGSINQEGALEVRATKPFAENTLNRIIHMVEEAQERKGERQRFIERFGRRYSPLVLLSGVLLAVVPPLFLGGDWLTWAEHATVFVVAASPCALVISVPVTLVATLGTAARHGVLIKGGVYVEALARVTVVALDKTGTLTQGEPKVTDVVPLADVALQDLLAWAVSVESRSEHPLARAIVAYGQAQGVPPRPVEHFQAVAGAGAMATLEGKTVAVGSPDWFVHTLGVALQGVDDLIARMQAEGKTVVLVGDKEQVWGLIAVRDTIRPNAARAVAALHHLGVKKVVMLTGDNERAARAIAREVGIDEVYTDLKPGDKLRLVEDLAARYGSVVMVGDGVNDAPALAAATVGVAMGAAGTDVALETADVALMADDLEKLAYALALAQRSQRIVKQNLLLSVLVIGALVVGAVGGWFSLPAAVLGHEISEYVVIANGLRMLRG